MDRYTLTPREYAAAKSLLDEIGSLHARLLAYLNGVLNARELDGVYEPSDDYKYLVKKTSKPPTTDGADG